MKSLAYSISDEEFKQLVECSVSQADLMRKLGYYCTTGNSFDIVKRRMKELNIFPPEAWKNTTAQAHIKEEISIEDYFVKGVKRSGSGTREKLKKYNLIEYKCAICGNTGEWNGKPLVLQVDHINGDHLDNRLENLRFLCPNCHSQTETFAGKNLKKSSSIQKPKPQHKLNLVCEKCGIPISDESKNHLCHKCFSETRRTVERPDKDALAIMVAKEGFSAIGRKYGVSESAIRKWCKTYDLPTHIEEIRQYVIDNNLGE